MSVAFQTMNKEQSFSVVPYDSSASDPYPLISPEEFLCLNL